MTHKKLTLAISMLSSVTALSNVLLANNKPEMPCPVDSQNVCYADPKITCPSCRNSDAQALAEFNADTCPFYNTLSTEEKSAFEQLIKELKDFISEFSSKDFKQIADKHIDILNKYATFKNISLRNISLTFSHRILDSTSNLEPKQITQESDLGLKEFFATLTPEEVAQVEELLNELDNLGKEITTKLDTLFDSNNFSIISTAIKNNNKILQIQVKFEQHPSLLVYNYQRIVS